MLIEFTLPNLPFCPFIQMITVHIRRGDFAQQCWVDKPCRTGTEKFAQAVQDVKKQLAEERGLDVTSVFVTSGKPPPSKLLSSCR
jgi:hypothetical protein